MENTVKINDNIYRLTLPYKDIYTTVYVIKTEKGVLLFDSASYDSDIEEYILPFLFKLNITADMLKYVFISHDHNDHSGGLGELIKKFPDINIIAKSPEIKERYKDANVIIPKENDVFMDYLKVINITGHTAESIAVYDMRTKTLISGDCLQLYGIYGSGKWGANISFPIEHIKAVGKLRNMDIEHIFTAHDYHPCGYSYIGKEEVLKALDACVSPLYEIEDMIKKNPEFDDEKICELYNSAGKPTLGVHVVTAVRNENICSASDN